MGACSRACRVEFKTPPSLSRPWSLVSCSGCGGPAFDDLVRLHVFRGLVSRVQLIVAVRKVPPVHQRLAAPASQSGNQCLEGKTLD